MIGFSRREFLQGTLAAGAAIGAAGRFTGGRAAEVAAPDPDPTKSTSLIAGEAVVDTHVYLGSWPFRTLAGSPSDIFAELRKHGVGQAWTGAFEGLFHKDLAAVNARLAEDCRRHGGGLLVPFGSVNPTLPDWQEDLRRCHEVHRMPGIRLHPGYHSYPLTHPAFGQVLESATERGLLVQLVAWMEDERHHHRLMPVPTVNLAPLAEQVQGLPGVQLIVANGFRSPDEKLVKELAQVDGIFFDFAKLDVIDGLADSMKTIPPERILFGSFTPMFYTDSTLLKLKESVLTDAQLEMICRSNAKWLLADARKPAAGPNARKAERTAS